MSADEHLNPVQFHGTTTPMKAGDEFGPHPERGAKKVWMTPSQQHAQEWADFEASHRGGQSHVYEVEPVGKPTLSKRKGDRGEQFYSAPRARVIRER